MTAHSPSHRSLQTSILRQSQTFLVRLQTGAPDELLISLLFQIRRDEAQLMRQHQMLHPRLWNILFTRYINRKPIEIINTLN